MIPRFKRKPAKIILDPFAGGGSTAYATKLIKSDYIAIEISEKYCQLARDRLAQEILL